MKNKNILIGVTLAAAAGIAYFVSKVKKQKELITDTEIKAKQDAEKAAADLAKAVAKAKVDAASIANRNSFAAKVSTIQQYLGVNPDGAVGPNTNMALTKKFPKYSTITTSNVDSIITDIDSDKKSASDLAAKKVTDDAKNKVVNTAREIQRLGNDRSYVAELTKNHYANLLKYDEVTKSWKYMGEKKNFYSGDKFGVRVSRPLTALSSGNVLAKLGSKDYYEFSASMFILRKV
jgi:hypothetical protein